MLSPLPHRRPRSPRITSALLAAGLASACLTTGCAVDSAYPSLSPRPIEDISLAEPTQRPAPAGTPNAEAATHYAPIVERARTADAEFRRTLDDARDVMVRGRKAEEGSDEWLAAQEALSRVEALRNPVTAALSDMDAARNGPGPRTDSGEAAAAAQAYEKVRAIDAAEAQALTAVWPGH